MFIVYVKIFNVVYLKQFSFNPSANVKPMSHDQVHAMPWHCMFFSLCAFLIEKQWNSALKNVFECKQLLLLRDILLSMFYSIFKCS
jgi:hypothetical protein